jgi:SAM-dependent methyltransferase
MSIDKKVYEHFHMVHHNDNSPQEVVPILAQIFNPKSVIDIGCGVGNFLREFKKNGIEEILGVDGEWADFDEIQRNLGKDKFISYDLKDVFKPQMKFDLATSFEVAEHIDEKYANNFVTTLTNCSDNIVFSAAIPLQGGQNHINEQWNEYWISKFDKLGYTCIDFLKPYFWENENVFWWYKQNILFFTRTPNLYQDKFEVNKLSNVIHKEIFELKTLELESLRKTKLEFESVVTGGYSWKFYCKNLVKSLIKIFS